MERKMGSIKSPTDVRDYKIAKISKETIILPKEFQLSASIIKDQGTVGSCVAHALSSAIEKKENKMFSTGWIYGYRPDDYWQGEGMYPREALKTIQKLGAVEHVDFAYNIEMMQAKILVDKNLDILIPKAEPYKIEAYARLNSHQQVKEFLYATKTPIPFSIEVAKEGFNLNKNNTVIVPSSFKDSLGGHMMLIIGWNETGFIIQNSWGKNWGNQGTAILPYEYPISEAWAVTFKQKVAPEPKPEPNIITPVVEPPALYLFRQIIQFIIELFNKIFKK